MKIALFGGSFNPPHVGHLLACAYVAATSDIDKVWLMPAFRHPFGKPLVPFEDRVAMCGRLAAVFAGKVEVTLVEADVAGEGRTVDTLEHLAKIRPDDSFRLVIGSDVLHETRQWKAFERVRQLAPLIVLFRGGHPHPEACGPIFPVVSSTEVRARIASGVGAEELVPRDVLSYVREKRLYGAALRSADG